MSLPLVPALIAVALANSVPAQPASPSHSQMQPDADPMIVRTNPNEGVPVCLKLRVYHFERNDGAAPKFVRETTCSTVRPYLHKTRAPKARLVPAE